jgi:hypothetical protein
VAAGAELAAGALLAGGLELLLELQAATPATRKAATAIAHHRGPVPVRCRISVKRTIAPFRLSALNALSCQPLALPPAGKRN